MAKPAIPLGPFELHAPIARGGMGEVWRGAHVREQLPVAVKLITATRARRGAYLDALRNEVRAMARLDHPGIVLVLDQGEIPQEAERASQDRLVAGSPFLVMELADGGALKRMAPIASWSELRRVLIAVLDALAHAHARGVVHRDIKPGNVLVTHRDDGEAHIQLTDFGIAHALHAPGSEQTDPLWSEGGTPRYMAPEQIAGDVRDQGPWTDLYSVGCLTFWLAGGEPPFWRGDAAEIYRAHCIDPVPPIVPRFPFPRGLQGWIERMMAKRPADRFRFAADAADALMAIDPADVVAPRDRAASSGPRPDRPAWSLDATTLLVDACPSRNPSRLETVEVPSDVAARAAEAHRTPPGGVARPARDRARRVPPDWRGPRAPVRSFHLLGAGLGLYGLRPVPLADREPERDRLWAALRDVSHRGRPRVVALHGPSGIGKSRIAEWLAERTLELGLASVLRVTHGPIPGPTHGLAPMIARHARCVDLRDVRLRDRLSRVLGELPLHVEDGEAAALAELIAPGTRPGAGYASPLERFVAVRRYLAQLAAERPVVLLLDDVQWSSETLAFVDYLARLADTAPLPVLVLMTVREEALADRPSQVAQLDALLELEGTERMDVTELAPADHAELVERLLGLEGSLARQVTERTSGNALFAIQLVGDWVHRGLLEAGHEGFRLRRGASAELPDDIHALWTRRVDRLAESVAPDRPEDVYRSLEVAAALGQEVDRREWEGACRHADVNPPADLLDAMATARLAMVRPERLSFVHGMLRESLERRARENRRWKAHHRACRAMLGEIDTTGRLDVAERVARHALAAGDHADALEPLLVATRERVDGGDFRAAHLLLAEREALLEEQGVARTDTRSLRGAVLRAGVFAIQGHIDDARRCIDDVRVPARDTGDPELLAELSWLEGGIALKTGDPSSEQHFRDSLERNRALGREHHAADCLHGIGEVMKWRGDLEGSKRALEEACQAGERAGDLPRVGRSLTSLADTLARTGEEDRALEMLEQSRDYQVRAGARDGLAVTLNSLGDLWRRKGDLDAAEKHYREAIGIMEELASVEIAVLRLNLVLTLMARGDFGEPERILRGVLRQVESSHREALLVFVHAGLVACAGARADWEAWDGHYGAMLRHFAQTRPVDDDMGWFLQHAGDRAVAAGDGCRARDCYALALEQWRALGRTERARSLEAALDPLP